MKSKCLKSQERKWCRCPGVPKRVGTTDPTKIIVSSKAAQTRYMCNTRKILATFSRVLRQESHTLLVSFDGNYRYRIRSLMWKATK